jgi:hypothetical protein
MLSVGAGIFGSKRNKRGRVGQREQHTLKKKKDQREKWKRKQCATGFAGNMVHMWTNLTMLGLGFLSHILRVLTQFCSINRRGIR